jgi:hypothetical protein
VTAYSRLTSDGLFKAVSTNARNEFTFVTQRSGGRMIERMEQGLLLDEAEDFTFASPMKTLTGLSRFNGREIWVIGDNNVYGPFTVSGSSVTLETPVSEATVGTWKPPVVETLPPPRDVSPGIVLQRRGRIHSVHISLEDTTSLAISTNGQPLREVDLYRYGATADVSELENGFTGTIKISGLRGFSQKPYLTISQKRPGRLNVLSITVEAAL